MKWTGKDFNSAIRDGFQGLQGILFYGADRSLSLETMKSAEDRLLPNGDDGFSLFELEPDRLKDNPALLSDEAHAISFTNDKKVIKVKNAAAETAEAVKILLKNPTDGAFVLVLANELQNASPLRTLFEYDKRLGCVAAYQDEGRTLNEIVREVLIKAGIRNIQAEVMDKIVANLGENRATTRAELEKLALYLYGRDEVTIQDIDKCMMDSSTLEFRDLSNAIAEGNSGRLAQVLPRLINEGNGTATLVRIVLNHFKRLYFLRAELDNGANLTKDFLQSKGVFWKEQNNISRQLGLWSTPKLLHAVAKLNETEIQVKSAYQDGEIILSQILFYLCKNATGKK